MFRPVHRISFAQVQLRARGEKGQVVILFPRHIASKKPPTTNPAKVGWLTWLQCVCWLIRQLWATARPKLLWQVLWQCLLFGRVHDCLERRPKNEFLFSLNLQPESLPHRGNVSLMATTSEQKINFRSRFLSPSYVVLHTYPLQTEFAFNTMYLYHYRIPIRVDKYHVWCVVSSIRWKVASGCRAVLSKKLFSNHWWIARGGGELLPIPWLNKKPTWIHLGLKREEKLIQDQRDMTHTLLRVF